MNVFYQHLFQFHSIHHELKLLFFHFNKSKNNKYLNLSINLKVITTSKKGNLLFVSIGKKKKKKINN